MILREKFGQHLRLGNFLFQWAYNIKLQKKFGCEAWYPENYYLWQYLKNPPITFKEEPPVDILVRPKQWAWSQEEMDEIESLDFNQNISFALNHFMQSAKWWKGCEKEVVSSLEPTSIMTHYLIGKHKPCFSNRLTIGLGIRLGDFIGHGDFFQIPHSWYIKALDQEFDGWREGKYLVVVFSDDIPKAKQLFKDYNFYYTDFNDTASHRENFKYYHGDASEQFFLGTMMDNFLCGNSTFTWWQSFLATHGRSGKVVHCGEVFRGKRKEQFDITNYYPQEWIKVPV